MKTALAKAPPALAAELSYDLIPLSSIAVSTSHIQAGRRARFDIAALTELAESIKAVGVVQPILLRPHPHPDHLVRFELVAGERRYVAADRAGLAMIPALTRDIPNDQVVEIQLIENLQREGLHALDEADGYAELMHETGCSKEALADKIGKSRSYVYARLKLIDLTAESRAAYLAGSIDMSKALLIARIRNIKLQGKALDLVIGTNWRGEPLTYAEAFEAVRKKLTADLSAAPFDRDDATLVADAGSCPACPEYAHMDTAHLCTMPKCYGAKVQAHNDRRRAGALAKGLTVIEGEKAQLLKPQHWTAMPDWVELDLECQEYYESLSDEEQEKLHADSTTPTYRTLLGDAVPVAALMFDPHAKQWTELAPRKDVAAALKKKGVEISRPKARGAEPDTDSAKQREEQAKADARRQTEETFRKELLKRIHTKFKGPLTRDDLSWIVEQLTDMGDEEELAELCYGGDTFSIAKMDVTELTRLLAEISVASQISINNAPTRLLALAKRCRIDPVKVRKELTAQAKAAAGEKTPADKKPAKKKR